MGTQSLDSKSLSKASGLECSKVYTSLCTDQIGNAVNLIKKGEAVIACAQEQVLFEELADEIGADLPSFVDIRDRAGWSDEGAKATPKMAALIRDSQLPLPSVKARDVSSDGRCLIIGPADIAMPAAEQLCEVLSVTVLLENPPGLLSKPRIDVILGRLKSATGTLGNFTLRLDALQLAIPGGRGAPGFGLPRDGGLSECDIILDLSGNPALFNAPDKRDGYLRADPQNPAGVASAIFDAAQLEGEFEKPIYVDLDPHVCAHSRAGVTGCSACINACQTGAISPDGEHVSIDPMVCAGCGTCAMLCPSGAITFQAPPASFLLNRLQIMAETYRAAGGKSPRLLVHDTVFGSEMFALAARHDRGLPCDVIPLDVEALTAFGHAEMLAALALGFAGVDILLAPKTEREPLQNEMTLALTINEGAQLRLLDQNDPEALCETLYAARPKAKPLTPILPIGNRRQITRLAAMALTGKPDTPLTLPEGAPYGAVVVDQNSCTLCLSCVSLCPSGALLDNPDMPQLRFQEEACLQCGICVHACPENSISLSPQLNLNDTALAQIVLHEEEPFACISCGALFGVKSTIDRIMEQLAGKHPMFATSESGQLIQMCEKCRVEMQYLTEESPFKSSPRPRTRTTDDYLKRRDH